MSWSDNAIENEANEKLRRTPLIDSLAEILSGQGLETPLVVGIYGSWGTGKTTVMKLLRRRLDDPKAGSLTLWFEAWQYARAEQSLWRALLLAVTEALGDEKEGLVARILIEPVSHEEIRRLLEKGEIAADETFVRQRRINGLTKRLDEMRASLYRSLSLREKGDLRVNWAAAVPWVADIGLRLATAGLSEKLGIDKLFGKLNGEDAEKAMQILQRDEIERYREQLTSLEQFHTELRKLIEEEIIKRDLRLVIFVDDLDRCLPEDAVAALEAIKLFFGLRGCVFVLGMDRQVVERGILSRFPPIQEPGEAAPRLRIDPRQYLDKIIQIPCTLPPLIESQVQSYLDYLLDRQGLDARLRECRSLIEIATPPNPRTLKRVLNVLALLLPLAPGDETSAKLLAKLVLMQVLFREAYERVAMNPLELKEFERAAKGGDASNQVRDLVEASPGLGRLLSTAPNLDQMGDFELRATVAHLVEQTTVTQ